MTSSIPSAETLARHRAEPHISPREHIARLRLELGRSLRRRRAVYLDTRYWIFLRDAALDKAIKPVHRELLSELRRQVCAGQLFCPLSATLFLELMKQTVPESRAMTRQLVSELSAGVALCDERERMQMEIADLLTQSTVRTRPTRRDRIWTRLHFLLGHWYMRDPRFSPEDERVLQKAFADHLWHREGTELLALESFEPLTQHFDGSAQRLNASNAAHADEVGTFDEVYVAEIAGTLDLFAGFATDLIESMMKAECGGGTEEFTAEKRAEHEKTAYTVLVNIARAGKGAISFPTLHLQAKCHAAIRRDKRRLLNGNTLLDLHHGMSVVYCDAFFTEGPLMTLLTSRPVEVSQEFGCRVIADEHAALEFLRKL